MTTLLKIAQTLDTHREELNHIEASLHRSALDIRARHEALEQVARARQAVGLARATIINAMEKV